MGKKEGGSAGTCANCGFPKVWNRPVELYLDGRAPGNQPPMHVDMDGKWLGAGRDVSGKWLKSTGDCGIYQSPKMYAPEFKKASGSEQLSQMTGQSTPAPEQKLVVTPSEQHYAPGIQAPAQQSPTVRHPVESMQDIVNNWFVLAKEAQSDAWFGAMCYRTMLDLKRLLDAKW